MSSEENRQTSDLMELGEITNKQNNLKCISEMYREEIEESE